MGSLFQDLRYAIRTLSKSPVFTSVAVLSLALGIGANTAIFTLLDQVILRLLPVKDPQELVLLTSHGSHYGNNRGRDAWSYPNYEDFRDGKEVFNGVLCRYQAALSMSYNGQTERVIGELVSGNYFQVLCVGAALGRTITPDDDRVPGGHPLVMLSYGFWKSRFALDRAILGKTIHLNNYPMTVIGVTPERFDGTDMGQSPQVRVPIMMKAQMTPLWDDMKNRRSRWVNIFARLKPGVTAAQAKAHLQPIFHSLREMETREAAFARASAYSREQFLKATIDVIPAAKGSSSLRRQYEKPLEVLMAIVALVLLIACANLANLLIARAAARQKETAVRLALGASRFRIVRQLLVESVLLALAGGAAGLAFAFATDRLLLNLLPAGSLDLSISSRPDARVFAFSLAVSFLTGILFGLLPAVQSTRPNLAETLKEQAGSVMGGGAQMRIRKALIVAQVGLSLLLLIGAGLFIRSLENLKSLDPGFRAGKLLTFAVNPRLNGYQPEQAVAFYRQLTDALNALPGVRSASLASVPIMEGWEWDSSIAVEGYESKPGEDMNPWFNEVSPSYFATMGIPLVAGRDFNLRDLKPADEKAGATVAIVNEKFARHYFGEQPAIGRHIGQGGDPGTKTGIEIVGVVKDAKYTDLRQEIPRQVFVSLTQDGSPGEMTAYVRTASDPAQMAALVRREIHRLDANLPVYRMKTLEVKLDESLVTERLIASLSTAFSALATLLAVIGLYGIMAYAVARRSREIGIRMALGASSGRVVWLVMREVVLLVAAGITLGLASAWAATRLVAAQLYGITASDHATLLAAIGLLALIALAAGYIPALRATLVNPIEVLRYE